jgi:cell division transport system permease protein
VNPLRWFFRTSYVLRRAVKTMFKTVGLQLATITTMALCMTLLCTSVVCLINAQRLSQRWGIDVPVTVYVTREQGFGVAQSVRAAIERKPVVVAARLVTPDEALKSLRNGLGTDDEVLSGIDPSYLPFTIEVSLQRDTESAALESFGHSVRELAGVEQVVFAGEWLKDAKTTVDMLAQLGLALGSIISIACVAIVWNTIHLGVLVRARELEVLGLVGATARFVRAPFLVEGAVQGALAMGGALLITTVVFETTSPWIERGLALILAADGLVFLTPREMVWALGFGALLGVLGARLAVSRYVRL